MMIEKLARKLAPLRPRQVRRWQEARVVADSQMRTLLDQELTFTARKLLGPPESKLLLSLPSPSLAKGRFHIGTVQYEQPKWPFGLRTAELLQGLAVFGRAGAGKTNAVFHLLLQLASQHVPFLFLDWKRTLRHLLPHLRGQPQFYTPGRSLAPLAFNPFMPPVGLEPRLYAHQVVDVLGAAYTLGEGARSLLQKILVGEYEQGRLEPSARDLLDRLQKLPVTGRARQWHVSAVRALESLVLADLGRHTAERQHAWVSGLLNGSTIIELDGLNIAARQFLVPTLFLWLYYVQLAAPRREQLQLVLVIEEAHHVLYRQEHRARESIMNMLLRQCREIGIGVIVVDQHPHLIASAALGNTFATLCLNQKDPADINKAAALCLLDEEDKPWLSRLPVGQAIVKMQDRWREAFVVQVPPVAVTKGAVTDGVLRAYVHRKQAGSGTWRRMLREESRFGQVRGGDEPPPKGNGAGSDGVHREASGSDQSPNSESNAGHALVDLPEEQNSLGKSLRADALGSPLYAVPLDNSSLAFLHDVVVHPDDGVKARYRRLRWSMSRGTRIKDALVFGGWLESQWLPQGNARRLLLRLSPAARRVLGLGVGSDGRRESSGRESLVHEYWKRFYANHFEKQGYNVTLEAPRPPPAKGRVDVLARRDGETIAIEIETGASNVVENVRQDLRAGYRVVVVGTNRSVARTIERESSQLARWVRPRVQLRH